MGYKIPRLQQQIKLKVAQILQRDMADPRMGLITVTDVELARDLSRCVVSYSVLGGETERSRVKHMLEDGRGFIQREVASILRTRKAPRLEFEFDESIEGSIRIAEKLREVLPPREDEIDEDGDEREASPEERDREA